MSDAIIDTNVAVVANVNHQQASPPCVENCIQKLLTLMKDHQSKLILDKNDEIFSEYKENLSLDGQPGVGDAFMKWVHNNKENPEQCTKLIVQLENGVYPQFPNDPALNRFDRSDRKFAVLSIISGVPVSNASDSDWKIFEEALESNAIQIEFLCPDYPFKDN